MKRTHCTIALAAVAAVGLSASVAHAQQPTFDLLADVDVSGIDAVATGVTFLNGDAFVVGFGGNKLIRISDVLTDDPTVTEIADADDDTDVSFDSGRGLTSITTTSAGELLVSGDTGTDGKIFVYDTDGNLVRQLAQQVGGSDRRIGGAVEIGSGATEGRVLASQVGSGMWTFNPDLDALAGTSFISVGEGFLRDITLVGTGSGTDIYASTTASGNDTIQVGTGGDVIANGNTADYSFSEFYDFGFSSFNAARGIDLFTYDGDDFIAATTGSEDTEIRFISTDDGTVAFALDDTDGIGQSFGVKVVEENGDQFVLIAQSDTDGENARVSVYGVDGAELIEATAVGSWDLY